MAGAWDADRCKTLSELFLQRGEIHQEAGRDPEVLTKETAAKLPEGLALPESLANVLKLGAKWNFQKKSCDVFGCNLYVVLPESTTFIWGDDDCRSDWQQEHGNEESTASRDWALVCVTSEYDYFFVNVRKDSPNFGATRHIVNNCNEESPFTAAPFENFLDVVVAWTEKSTALLAEAEDEDDVEYPSLHDFLASKKSRAA
eukprot:TRINITY_DN3960_c0_g1_i1.p1 TRINITY_DN3960_c0_g1~~TRINITY_DN3960_c0_g1_i1.p1  ORF type:complete len:201 (-),score=54.61 TRINITY_DN3960_c0_g1_i1:166-768(-)